MRLILAIVVVAVAAEVIGCKSSPAVSRNETTRALSQIADAARGAGLADEEIARAQKLYIAKCARCHKFYDPTRYDDVEWHSWMTKMSKKARLKPDQEKLLSQYLEVFRARQAQKNSAPNS
jgi:nitrate/TMAO reductase-like tetraheme cytochrome c subunit